jgi:hypothetical protein
MVEQAAPAEMVAMDHLVLAAITVELRAQVEQAAQVVQCMWEAF